MDIEMDVVILLFQGLFRMERKGLYIFNKINYSLAACKVRGQDKDDRSIF